jgi:hypothetical protein
VRGQRGFQDFDSSDKNDGNVVNKDQEQKSHRKIKDGEIKYLKSNKSVTRSNFLSNTVKSDYS